MITEQNIAVVLRSVEEFFNAGNMAVADEIFSADYVGHGSAGLGDTSRAEAIEQVTQLHQAFRNLAVEVEHVVASGELVALHYRMRGTDVKSGRSFDVLTVSIDRVVDGKIVEAWYLVDEVAMQQQLGG
jgi:predicted SnoaL-like aldol condensation-catalyzing enzyme